VTTVNALPRRRLLRTGAALSAAGLLGACSSASGGSSSGTVRTQLSWLKTVTFAGYYIAEEKRWFAKEGVRAPLLSGGPSVSDVVSVVVGGGADVVLADFAAIIKARSAGADLVAFGSVFQTSPGGFVSLASHPVRTARDLVGRRIGLSPGSETLVEAIFKVNGLPVRYTRVPIGSGTTPLTSGKCDVMACYVTAQPLALRARGVDVVTVTQEELGLPDYALVMAARRGDLHKRRDDFTGYLRAVIRGYGADIEDPSLGTRLTVEKYGRQLGLDRRAVQAENEAQIRLLRNDYTDRHGLCRIDTDRLAGPVYRGLRARGLSKLPPVRTVFDATLLQEASQRR
jgi:ABC-type nitrate/sulfonate/bicarbonate transport system substrate-binding protein